MGDGKVQEGRNNLVKQILKTSDDFFDSTTYASTSYPQKNKTCWGDFSDDDSKNPKEKTPKEKTNFYQRKLGIDPTIGQYKKPTHKRKTFLETQEKNFQKNQKQWNSVRFGKNVSTGKPHEKGQLKHSNPPPPKNPPSSTIPEPVDIHLPWPTPAWMIGIITAYYIKEENKSFGFVETIYNGT